MPTIKITPLDTLFFRDGKPFSMGEETFAEGIFPPSPSVFYGALRTAYFSENPEEIDLANTEKDPTIGLEINFLTFALSNSQISTDNVLYFHKPSDIVMDMKTNELVGEYKILNIESRFKSNSEIECIMEYSNKIENQSDILFSFQEMDSYLNNNSEIKYKGLRNYVTKEIKIGIGRNSNTNTTQDGQLYKVSNVRMEDEYENRLSFVITYNGIELNKTGYLKLGADNKVAHYTTIDFENFDVPKDFDKFFKIYLLTPSILKNLADFEHKVKSLAQKYGLKVKLIASSMQKIKSVGGFMMGTKSSRKAPKPMFKFIPETSVFIFKSETILSQEFLKALNNFKITNEYAKQGYGICLIAKCNENE